jgi:hypothetical protein
MQHCVSAGVASKLVLLLITGHAYAHNHTPSHSACVRVAACGGQCFDIAGQCFDATMFLSVTMLSTRE